MKNFETNIISRYNPFSLYCSSASTLLTFTITLFVPAFLLSCTAEYNDDVEYIDVTPTITAMGKVIVSSQSDIDIFVFNDDELRRLDSYQRLKSDSYKTQHIASRSGKKIIVAIVNSHKDRYEWANINSYESLLSAKASLEQEDKGKLLMTGTSTIQVGKSHICDIEVSPLVSEIVLNTIKCDFSLKPYKEAKLTDTKVYLTNVNASVSILQTNEFMPERIINLSQYYENDLNDFVNPEIIYRQIYKPIDYNIQRPDIRLYCYPNEAKEESPGSPFTKMVIEGFINGEKYYYPISINRGKSEERANGIGRNSRYIYDIVIKSLGSKHPDIDISPEMAEISCRTSDWNDMTDTEILF